MKYGLKDEYIEKFIAIIEKFDCVEKIVLFGSRAMGNYKKASDVDIALFGENVNWGIACSIKYKVEDETTIPYFFDSVAYNTIKNDALKEHINTEGVVLWKKI